jgi:small subunit ribosomal protein S1
MVEVAKKESMQTENFQALLEESFKKNASFEGKVVKGTIIAIEKDSVLIDAGLKSEGRISLKEFGFKGQELKVGDIIDVFVERMEDRHGEAVLSYEKARREAAWEELETAHKDNQRVMGSICGRVKGGFTVDLAGAIAFLPGSQVDIRPIKDIAPLMGIEQPFQILKMDRPRGNIVVSRRAVMEESRAEAKSELIENLEEGRVLQGVVKNITDYGAFVDLGGVDGLLHVTDISWQRITHPSEVLSLGQTIDVQVIKFNAETKRISLGMKQLEKDPWVGIEERYILGSLVKGVVTNVTDYGVFVELEPGIEGLIHVSELSWTKKNIHPNKIVSPSEEVVVKVLDVDAQKRRISLSLRQCADNPWTQFAANHQVGQELEGEIKNITEFGLFVGLEGGIDGMVHASDLAWEKAGEVALADYKKGEVIKVKLLDMDVEKERISLGVKQLGEDPFAETMTEVKTGEIVTCVVTNVLDNGIEVSIGTSGVQGFIRKADLARDRSEQRSDRFAVDEKIDALVTSVDRKSRRINLSIKAREIKEEKEAMAEYGSSDSGASLGDILGAAIDLDKVKKELDKKDK